MSAAQPAPRPWRRVARQVEADHGIFRTRVDQLENPRTGRVLARVVLENPDWVNVVARTPVGDIVVVQQYRFGIEAVTTEIPGGMVDPGEEPLAAAQRELLEETGYRAPRWTYLGCVEPNPAFQDNLCHHFLAEDAERVGELQLDAGEDIRVLVLEPSELRRAVQAGTTRHCLVLSALCQAGLLTEVSWAVPPAWTAALRSPASCARLPGSHGAPTPPRAQGHPGVQGPGPSAT